LSTNSRENVTAAGITASEHPNEREEDTVYRRRSYFQRIPGMGYYEPPRLHRP
jgi:hypothetical protein